MKEIECIKVAVRLDDITSDMDWGKFYKFKEILDKYQINPLIGVVPDNQDKTLMINPKKEAFFLYVKELEAQGWSIAQHGYQHTYKNHKGGLFPLNYDSEFTGDSYELQYERLQKGTEILEKNGIIPKIYMAPSHSFDRNTIKALLDLGFTHITDGFGKTPYKRHGITFLPIAFHSKKSLQKKKGVTTLVFHTNTLSDSSIANWDKLFGTHQKNLISYDQFLSYPAKERNWIGNVKEYLMAVCKYILVRIPRV